MENSTDPKKIIKRVIVLGDVTLDSLEFFDDGTSLDGIPDKRSGLSLGGAFFVSEMIKGVLKPKEGEHKPPFYTYEVECYSPPAYEAIATNLLEKIKHSEKEGQTLFEDNNPLKTDLNLWKKNLRALKKNLY